jgi:hypothetical protein
LGWQEIMPSENLWIIKVHTRNHVAPAPKAIVPPSRQKGKAISATIYGSAPGFVKLVVIECAHLFYNIDSEPNLSEGERNYELPVATHFLAQHPVPHHVLPHADHRPAQ